ncbi:hypothetical protein RM190_10595 [Paracoccus sp. CPCC 101403]|uniref:Secreted protein n=1 Tax=Paracoccus broussonetiae TaxID=3075834 RepID=A0ABU3EDK2_9RHOB|nr:hypothetical protein [Paracoccus sp. CPCC 101403]MDT1062310.1 hypothetical protein [Paracoccus sp. CPCC 101403]
MVSRFEGLRKIPSGPAARMLAAANARLVERTGLPASADVAQTLSVLDQKAADMDILRLLSVALPPRERVWWACLAARDTLAPDAGAPPTLTTAEAWVRKPGDETKAAARQALEAADPDDDLTLCATAAVFADGTLGAGDLARLPSPPGASEAASFGMNVLCIARRAGDFRTETARLIDRGLDIARGGNGRGQP